MNDTELAYRHRLMAMLDEAIARQEQREYQSAILAMATCLIGLQPMPLKESLKKQFIAEVNK